MGKIIRLYIGHACPKAMAGFGIQRLQPGKQLLHVRAVRTGFVGAGLELLPIAPPLGDACQLGLGDETEWADDFHRKLRHLQTGRHCPKGALEGEIHQERLEDIVLMVPEGYLVAAFFFGYGKKGLAARPRTEEAGGFAAVGRGVEFGLADDEGQAMLLGAVAEVILVGVIGDVAHHDVRHHDLEAGTENLRPPPQEIDQRERVLPARETDEDAVAITNKFIITDCLPDFLFHFAEKQLFFCQFCHLFIRIK